MGQVQRVSRAEGPRSLATDKTGGKEDPTPRVTFPPLARHWSSNSVPPVDTLEETQEKGVTFE